MSGGHRAELRFPDLDRHVLPSLQLSFAKTSSVWQVVDLPVPVWPQSRLVITLLLNLLRLVPFLVGGHRQIALENLALR
jgi:hypothetical protein